jgi:hypothetical protein
MPGWLLSIMVALITGGLIEFVQFLITRKDKKKDDTENIKKKLDKVEQDSTRLQLLFLIKQFPESTREIMKCAEYYFRELEGDWYMTSIFDSWLVSNNIAEPDWFDKSN